MALFGKWKLNRRQFLGLALYSCATPLGIYLMNQYDASGAVLLVFINLPFLVILGPLLMMAAQLEFNLLIGYLLTWSIIFAQSYLAFVFVFLRRRTERGGENISSTRISSVWRLIVISTIVILCGLAILSLLPVPRWSVH